MKTTRLTTCFTRDRFRIEASTEVPADRAAEVEDLESAAQELCPSGESCEGLARSLAGSLMLAYGFPVEVTVSQGNQVGVSVFLEETPLPLAA